MNTTPEQVAENRRKAVEWLRTTELPQGFGSLYNSTDDCYCAIGHMGLAVGIDAKDRLGSEDEDPYDEIERALSLGGDLEGAVMSMNDDNLQPLREIGDYLAEKWGIA